MATITINVPNPNLPPISDVNVKASLNEFPSRLSNVSQGETVDKYINKVAIMTKVPANLIKLFMFLTSKGDKTYVSKIPSTNDKRVPYGIMGLSDSTAQNTLYKEANLERLSLDEFQEILKNGISQELFDKKIQVNIGQGANKVNFQRAISEKLPNDYSLFNVSNNVIKMPLQDERFSILTGAFFIGQLLDKYGNKLEQIIPIYLNLDNNRNTDYNWAVNYRGSNMNDLYNKFSPTTKNAINLALSKGGFLNTFQ
jgi:hypothetical protein